MAKDGEIEADDDSLSISSSVKNEKAIQELSESSSIMSLDEATDLVMPIAILILPVIFIDC
ncbi:MAG: hypothetical protein LH649_09840 [Pseudanabaena sp. CAN_BIN31]|jgi:hypothetical protein|nr:hypothetical protein [Pseudanabaena sp. CAN_BIN31]